MSASSGMELAQRQCRELPPGSPVPDAAQMASWLEQLSGWKIDGGWLCKTFRFGKYLETVSFVHAVAWIAERQNHHPDLEVRYGECTIRYRTHSIDALSANDFICAARIEALGGSEICGDT